MQREFVYPLEDAPTPQCHASTIVETAAGTLMAAWFGGTHERHPDVGIWAARREGGVWTDPVEVATGVQASGERLPCWNPVLFQPREGPLLLFFKVGPTCPTWWGEMMVSHDDGRTWVDRRRLPGGRIGPVKNKPVQLADGAILCPSSGEHDGWQTHFEIARGTATEWELIGPIADPRRLEPIQPSFLVHPGGRLQALCRTRTAGVIAQTWSDDLGRTWSAIAPTTLANPNSGIDAATLADGRHLVVYNPLTQGRHRLNVTLSADGVAWRDVVRLEDERSGEFSYPAVIQAREGLIHVTYTYLRRGVAHVVLDPGALA